MHVGVPSVYCQVDDGHCALAPPPSNGHQATPGWWGGGACHRPIVGGIVRCREDDVLVGLSAPASGLKKLPNRCTSSWASVGGGGPAVLLLVGFCWALWGCRWALYLRWEASGTVRRFPNGAEDVILTRLRARTDPSFHVPAIRDGRFCYYKGFAAIVKDCYAFAKIRCRMYCELFTVA